MKRLLAISGLIVLSLLTLACAGEPTVVGGDASGPGGGKAAAVATPDLRAMALLARGTVEVAVKATLTALAPTQTPTQKPASQLSTGEVKAQARADLSYEELARNTEQYVGQFVYYSGEVIQVVEDGGSYTVRVNITREEYGWEDTILVTYKSKDLRPLEDDIIEFWGVVTGRVTYKAVLGNEITLPAVRAEIVMLAEPEAATAEPQPTPMPSPAVGKLGERTEASGAALTVLRVWKADKISEFFAPQEGSVYLIVEVLIENVSRNELSHGSSYFTVKDSDGYEYDAFYSAPQPELSTGELPKGERVRGNLAFQILTNAEGLILTYAPGLWHDTPAIRINLGQ